MALSGTLGDFSLTDILQLIGLQRKTGMLVLRQGDEEISIGFDNGRVVSAESSQRGTEQKVGQLLVRTGKLTEERLAEALRRQKATLQRLGHVLVENNWVDRDTVRRQLLLQVTETIYDLFRWKDGEYDFRPEARVEWDRGFIEPIPSENLLMEGARMVDEWPLVERVIPSRAVVLRPTERGAKMLALEGAAEAKGSVYDQDIDFGFLPADPLEDTGRARGGKLTERERSVLRWIDGHRTAGEIAELSGLGSFETFHLMAELVEAEILELAGATGEARVGPVPALFRAAAPARALLAAVIVLAALGGASGMQEALRALVPGPRILPAATPVASSDVLATAAGLERLRRTTSATRLDRLEAALATHFLDQGAWPRNLAELVDRGLVPEPLIRDPWGDPYAYDLRPWGYRLAETGSRGRAPLVREHRFTRGEHAAAGTTELASLP